MANAAKRRKEVSGSLWADTLEFELVRLAKTGHEAAFEELVNRGRDTCLRVAMSILKSREDAQDEVQQALVLAYRKIELFTQQSQFSTWLVRIVINCCFRRLRSSQRRLTCASHVTTDGRSYSFEAVTRHTPEMNLATREVKQALRRELRNIPPLLRVPLERHYMDELSVREVAEELGLTIGGVKSRLHRGHMFLRERMLRYAPQRGPASLINNDELRPRIRPSYAPR
jgi:RNA polymerase sigma-70 factor (ECF subfamily)